MVFTSTIKSSPRKETSIARYYGQAPLIDSVIYINEPLEIGKKYRIKITNKSDYDLEGEKL